MPKCVKCFKMFHPDFMLMVDEKHSKDLQCVFCHLNKNEVTITDDKNINVKMTKKQAIDSYDVYIKKLVEKNNPEFLVKKEKSNIIKPY